MKTLLRYLASLSMRLLLFGTLFLLSACYDPIEDSSEEEGKGDSGVSQTTGTLDVHVKSKGEVNDPVYLFVFDSQGSVVSRTTLTTDDNLQASFQLAKGNYRVAAFSGTSGYVVPNAFAADSYFSFLNDNYSASPLFMGQADVTIASQRQVLGLMLESQVAQVAISLDDVPEAATAVQVSFGPQYTHLSLLGERSAADRALLSFHRQSVGHWRSDSPCYVLPGSSSSMVMTLHVQFPDSTVSYGHSFNYGLQAGRDYHFSGHCSEISAPVDTTSNNDDFHFGTEETTDPLDSLPIIYVSALPRACSVADSWVVAALQERSDNLCVAMLVSLSEWKEVSSANSAVNPQEAAIRAQGYQEYSLRDWQIPTREEANLLKQLYAVPNLDALNLVLAQADGDPLQSLDSKDKAVRYLCNEAQHTFSFASGSNSITSAGAKTLYHLRLVKWVQFKEVKE